MTTAHSRRGPVGVLPIIALALNSAGCGSEVVIADDGGLGAGGSGVGTSGGSAGSSTGGSDSTGGQGQGGSDANGGQGPSPAWIDACEGIVLGGNFCGAELDKCLASSSCEDVLEHGPGSDLFACLPESGCFCLGEVYTNEPSPADAAYGEKCVESSKDCPVFEDLCLAGALFVDSYLDVIAACFDEPTCEGIRACVRETYGVCVGWAYGFEF